MRRRVISNAAVLAALKAGAPLLSLLVVLAVSRKLGAEGLGRYSLAYAGLAFFGLLGPLGLPALITREGARDRGALAQLLSTGLALGGFVSLTLAIAMASVGRILSHDQATARAMAVLSAAVLPSTWLCCFDAAFLALEDTGPIAIAAAAEHLVKVGLALAALLAGYGLDAVLGAAVAGRLVACSLSVCLLRRRGIALSFSTNLASIRALARQTPVFALSSLCATLYWRIDVLLLSHLRGLAETGYYTAAYRILDLANLLPQSLCQALYPQLAGQRAANPRQRSAALLWLILLAAPISLAVAALARPLLGKLYSPSFTIAAPALAILIWTAVPYAWSRYHACLLVATGQQRADLGINVVMLAANIALNLALIPRYGSVGAAVVTLVTALAFGAAQLVYLKRHSAQVRSLAGFLLRGRALQLLRRRRLSKQYLNVGCGDHPHRGFINLDRSWSPKIDLCWDITKSLPLGDDSLQGIYTEHCLEHVAYDHCRRLLEEFARILQPGGTLRIVVPDAELYLDLYQRAKHGEDVSFPYPETLPVRTPMMYVNRAFRSYGHLFAYDFETLRRMLLEAGFSDVLRRRFREGSDSALLIDSERREVESLYVEATKTPAPASELPVACSRRESLLQHLGLFSLFLIAATANAQGRPVINAVVSSADFQPGVAFEGLASVFGSGLSDQEYVAASVPLPTQLGQTQVRYCAPLSAVWDDCLPMQLLYVGPSQINLLLSYSSRDESQAIYGALVVRRNNTLSDETRRQAIVPVAPRIFAMGFDCNFDLARADPSPCRLMPQQIHPQQAVRGALTDSGGALVTSSNPARAGNIYSLWLTGLGRIANGRTLFPLQMTLGGIPISGSSGVTSMTITALYAGQSPQFAGLDQINFELPPNLMGGPDPAGGAGNAPLHPCGDYRVELVLSLSEGANNQANPIQIPVLIRNGGTACAN